HRGGLGPVRLVDAPGVRGLLRELRAKSVIEISQARRDEEIAIAKPRDTEGHLRACQRLMRRERRAMSPKCACHVSSSSPEEGCAGVKAVSANAPSLKPKYTSHWSNMNFWPSAEVRSTRYVLMYLTESRIHMSQASFEIS